MSIISKLPYDLFKYTLLFLATPEHDNVLKALWQKKIQRDSLVCSEVLEAAVYANLHDQLFRAEDMLHKLVFPFIAELFEALDYPMNEANFMIVINVIRNVNMLYARGLMFDHEAKTFLATTMESTQLETTIASIATLSRWFHGPVCAEHLRTELEFIIDKLDQLGLELRGFKLAVANREACTVRFTNTLLHLAHCSALCPHASLA